MRYESWAIVARMRVSSSAARNALRSSSSHNRSAHRLAIFVKICIDDAPIAFPRGGDWCVPPAIDMCAPSSTASSHMGAIHAGSLALSFFGLNAGRLVSFLLEIFRLAMKRLPAPRAVNWPHFGECIVIVASARARGLQRIMSADDA